MKKEYISYNEAKILVQKFHIVGEKTYREFVKSNTYNLPLHPERTYKDDGFTWNDFWGKEKKIDFLTYDECRKLLIDAGVKNNKEFRAWYVSHKNMGIPAAPDIIYKKSGEWTTWGDFLDSGNIFRGTYLSYIDAKKILVENRINSQSKYRKFRKEHTEYNLPASPNVIYAKSGEWTTWGDFFDSGFVATQLREYVPYSKAKQIVQDAGITSVKEFKKWIVIHPEFNIPNNPQDSQNYSSEWEGWGVFLGTENVSGIEAHHIILNRRSSICSKLLDKKDLLLMDKSTIRLLYIYLKCFDSELAKLLRCSIDKSSEERVEDILHMIESINEYLDDSEEYVEDDYDLNIFDDEEDGEDGEDTNHFELPEDIDEDYIDESEDDNRLIAIEGIMDEFDIDSLDDKTKKYLNEVIDCYIKKTINKEILKEY